jgi:hypothetical protein
VIAGQVFINGLWTIRRQFDSTAEIMEQDKFLQIASQLHSHRPIVDGSKGRLGAAASSYLDRRNKQFRKNASVAEAWKQLLPEVLYNRCTIAGITGKVLRVTVEPGPYMHEMQLLSEELLKHLCNQCKGCGITQIKFLPGNSTGDRD